MLPSLREEPNIDRQKWRQAEAELERGSAEDRASGSAEDRANPVMAEFIHVCYLIDRLIPPLPVSPSPAASQALP